jgi:hypothetical protein
MTRSKVGGKRKRLSFLRRCCPTGTKHRASVPPRGTRTLHNHSADLIRMYAFTCSAHSRPSRHQSQIHVRHGEHSSTRNRHSLSRTHERAAKIATNPSLPFRHDETLNFAQTATMTHKMAFRGNSCVKVKNVMVVAVGPCGIKSLTRLSRWKPTTPLTTFS